MHLYTFLLDKYSVFKIYIYIFLDEHIEFFRDGDVHLFIFVSPVPSLKVKTHMVDALPCFLRD